jgi:hypothetical protein
MKRWLVRIGDLGRKGQRSELPVRRTQSTAGRRAALIALGAGTLLLAACVSKPVRPANADGTWCHRVGKAPRYKLTCTSAPVPPPTVEAEARRFVASADRFTVYVVRKRWADAANVVKLTVDGGAQAETVPESFVRLRLPPGEHVLRASWSEGDTQTMVRGAAGEIRVVELAGSAWAWGSRYGLEPGDESSRDRVLRARMVADIE